MPGREQAELLVAELAAAIGLPGLTFREDGTLVLQIGDDLLLFLGVEGSGDALTILAPLPDSAGPKPPDLLERMLAANFMWRETGGATLAVDGQGGPVTVMRRLPLQGLAFPAFRAAMEDLVTTAQAWKHRVALARLSADPTASAPQEPPPERFLFHPGLRA